MTLKTYDPAPLEQYFQFPIAALVRVKAQVRGASLIREGFSRAEPQVGQIVERHVRQCYGGIQSTYDVRMSSGNWKDGIHTLMTPCVFLEHELELAPEPQPEAMVSIEPVDGSTVANPS